MYKLFYAPGACSLTMHVALIEIGQPYSLERIDMSAGANKTPEYLKLNPRGQVPVLADGDQVIREGAAIMLHILDKHNSPLLPKSGPERDLAIEWMMFCNATLHPAYSRAFFLMKNGLADTPAMKTAIDLINKFWAEVNDRLANNTYICGSSMTAADIFLTVIANWSGRMPQPVVFGDNTKRLLKEISSRPSFQKALAEESIEYKAAA